MIMLKFLKLIKDTFVGFSEDNAFKLTASLSYYTLVSLAPMLLVFFSIESFFYGHDAIRGKLYGQINGLVGKELAI
jgi:membrane protein